MNSIWNWKYIDDRLKSHNNVIIIIGNHNNNKHFYLKLYFLLIGSYSVERLYLFKLSQMVTIVFKLSSFSLRVFTLQFSINPSEYFISNYSNIYLAWDATWKQWTFNYPIRLTQNKSLKSNAQLEIRITPPLFRIRTALLYWIQLREMNTPFKCFQQLQVSGLKIIRTVRYSADQLLQWIQQHRSVNGYIFEFTVHIIKDLKLNSNMLVLIIQMLIRN